LRGLVGTRLEYPLHDVLKGDLGDVRVNKRAHYLPRLLRQPKHSRQPAECVARRQRPRATDCPTGQPSLR
jgi:hypothetical protein